MQWERNRLDRSADRSRLDRRLSRFQLAATSPRTQRLNGRLVRIETLDFLQRRAGVVQPARVDRYRSPKNAPIDPPPPHADLEALPLLSRSGDGSTPAPCKFRAQPQSGERP